MCSYDTPRYQIHQHCVMLSMQHLWLWCTSTVVTPWRAHVCTWTDTAWMPPSCVWLICRDSDLSSVTKQIAPLPFFDLVVSTGYPWNVYNVTAVVTTGVFPKTLRYSQTDCCFFLFNHTCVRGLRKGEVAPKVTIGDYHRNHSLRSSFRHQECVTSWHLCDISHAYHLMCWPVLVISD